MSDSERKESAAEPDHGNHTRLKLSPFGHLFRFIASWFGFTGLYAAFAVCPFCGQHGCPVGLASAATVGGLLALCIQDWRRLFSFIRHKLKKKARTDDGIIQ